MITPGYLQRMARYNRWQNISIYGAADGLSDAERRADRGSFFQSIPATLSHILWADPARDLSDAGVQSPNPSPGSGACYAHSRWREPRGYRHSLYARSVSLKAEHIAHIIKT